MRFSLFLLLAIVGCTKASLDWRHATLSDGPTYSFPLQTVGASLDKTITLTNVSSVVFTAIQPTAPGPVPPFSFKGGAYPGVGGTCGASLSAGASCSLVLTFAPASAGDFAGVVDLSYNDGAAETVSRVLSGSATGASGPNWDFGAQAVNQETDKAFTVTNPTFGPITAVGISQLSAPFDFKGGTFPGTGGTCSSSVALPAGGSCTVVLSMKPYYSGSFASSYQFSYNSGTTSTSMGLLTGSASGTVAVTRFFHFGALGQCTSAPAINAGPNDHLFSLNAQEVGPSAGYDSGATGFYVYPRPGLCTQPLYRCLFNIHHFLSESSTCEGKTPDPASPAGANLLGYVCGNAGNGLVQLVRYNSQDPNNACNDADFIGVAGDAYQVVNISFTAPTTTTTWRLNGPMGYVPPQ